MQRDPNTPVLKKGRYRHNKTGHIYEVLGVALHTETEQYHVVYRALEPNPEKRYHYEFFTRPYEMFVEHVTLNGKRVLRFEYIDVNDHSATI